MNREIIYFLITYQKWFLFFFCVVFGVIGKESYLKLKVDNYDIKNIGYKFVVAFLVCFPVKELAIYYRWDRWEPYIVMFTSCFHVLIMDWINKDLFPMLLKGLANVINKKIDDTKNDK